MAEIPDDELYNSAVDGLLNVADAEEWVAEDAPDWVREQVNVHGMPIDALIILQHDLELESPDDIELVAAYQSSKDDRWYMIIRVDGEDNKLRAPEGAALALKDWAEGEDIPAHVWYH
jgi:hypothetical protein